MINNFIITNRDIIIKNALAYLTDKYKGEFEFVNFIGQSLNFPGDRIGVRTKAGGETFTVFAYSENGNIVYRDSYYGVLKRDEYEKVINDVIKNHTKNFTFNVQIEKSSCNPNNLNNKTDITDIHKIQDGCYLFHSGISVIFPKTSKKKLEKLINGITNDIAGKRLICWIRYICEDVIYTYYIGSDYQPVEIRPALPASKSLAYSGSLLSNQQLERLCTIVYLNNLPSCIYLGNLGDIMLYMKYIGIVDNIVGNELPCEMTREEWDSVIDAVLDDPMLCRLEIPKYVDIKETDTKNSLDGHRALCFTDKKHNAYVIFRGTSGDDEWYDNALGMTEADTPYQKASADFVRETRKELDIKYLAVAGHSKGGNKAEYSAVTVSGLVDKCFSLDGQGFSKEFLLKYEDEIKLSVSKITAAAERRDFVNCLGFYLCKPTFYVGRRGNHSLKYPYGEPLPYFHCPDALRTSDGKIGEISETAYIPKTINDLLTYFFNNPKYSDIWEVTSVSVVSLLMRNKRAKDDEIVNAIINLILVFLELVALNKEFYDDLINLIETESDVLLATALMISKIEVIKETETEAKSLAKSVISGLASEMQNKPIYIAYFLNIVIKLTVQLVKVSKDDTLNKSVYILICDFISETINEIISKQKLIFLNPIYKRWIKLAETLKNSENITDSELSILKSTVDEIISKIS